MDSTTPLRPHLAVLWTLAVLVAAAGPVPRVHAVAPQDADSVLTRVAAVRSLSPERANSGRPVRLTATVTHVDTVWHLLFVQDETGGIFVQPYRPNETPPLSVRPGDRVRIRARTSGSAFAPHLVRPSIERLGPGRLPPVTTRRLSELFTGRFDSQFVRTEGTVVEAYVERSHLMMVIADGMTEVSARIPYRTEVPDRLVGSRVRVRGVAGTLLNDRDQLRGIYLAIASIDDLSVLRAGAADPSDLPARAIHDILRFQTDRTLHERVRVEGRVTYSGGRSRLFIQDTSGGIEVLGRDFGPYPLGTRVEVVAFPSPSERAPVLRHARVRSVASPIPLSPRPATAEEAADGRLANHLIALEGDLVSRTDPSAGASWILRTGGTLFHVQLGDSSFHREADSRDWEAPPEGSRVRLAGILSVPEPTLFEDQKRDPFKLLMRTPADVTVLDRPSWWTARRALGLAGGLGVLLLFGLGWIYALRRTVREKTATVRRQMKIETDLREKAQRAAEAREEMMTYLHHEIRSPLSSVIGFADLLVGRVREAHKVHLRRIQTSARQIMDLADRMLNYARLEAGQLEPEPAPIDVGEIVSDAVHTLEPQAREHGLTLSVDRPEEPVDGTMDRTVLGQIVRNLTGNAVKYADAGTVEVCVHPTATGDEVRIEVADQGPGMTKEERATVFEPFRQGAGGRDSGEGVGLGLHITSRLVELMDGQIELETAPGEGTRFLVRLPRHQNGRKEVAS